MEVLIIVIGYACCFGFSVTIATFGANLAPISNLAFYATRHKGSRNSVCFFFFNFSFCWVFVCVRTCAHIFARTCPNRENNVTRRKKKKRKPVLKDATGRAMHWCKPIPHLHNALNNSITCTARQCTDDNISFPLSLTSILLFFSNFSTVNNSIFDRLFFFQLNFWETLEYSKWNFVRLELCWHSWKLNQQLKRNKSRDFFFITTLWSLKNWNVISGDSFTCLNSSSSTYHVPRDKNNVQRYSTN